MPLFKGTRTCVTYEDVEVEADSYDAAREAIENDAEHVKVTGEREGDYELSGRLAVLEFRVTAT